MLKRDVIGNGLNLTKQDVIFNSLSLSDLLSAPSFAFTVQDMSFSGYYANHYACWYAATYTSGWTLISLELKTQIKIFFFKFLLT